VNFRIPPALQGLWAIVRLLPRIDRRRTIIFWAACAAQAALPLGAIVAMGALIGAAAAAAGDGLGSPGGRTALLLLVVVAVLMLASAVNGVALSTLATSLGRSVELDLQDRLIGAVGAPTGIAHIESPEVLSSLRVARQLGLDLNRPERAVQGIASIAPSWLTALGASAVLMAFSWPIGLAWLLSWPVLVLLMQREYVRSGRATYDRSTDLAETEYLRDLAITPEPAKELRIWGMLPWLTRRFDRTWEATMDTIRSLRRVRKRIVIGTSVYIGALFALTLVTLVRAGIDGAIGLGALGVALVACRAIADFKAFDDANVFIALAAVSVPRVLELEERLTADDRTARGVPDPEAPKKEVRFSDVRFAYPGAGAPVLDGLDLTLPAGTSTAIVGANGAGKTSLVKLLCGFYGPTAGAVTVDGTDLGDLDPVAWRRQIAALFQDFSRYPLTVRENITLGAPDRADDENAVWSAIDRIGVRDAVTSLPDGIDTVLSKEFTGGVDLSGGQWQRIALARVFFAVEAGARVLVLDEPTAALDVRGEAELYERFLDITAGLTTVVISHRYSTVRRADRIAVVEGGRVVELGGHDDLMAARGRYHRAFTIQAERLAAGTTPQTEASVTDAQ
jgi:ATP-binding cassette, subfamily B, bacterial